MPAFRPTVAAPGRLARLGVVLDLRNRPDRLREVARMCDGAGIESLWTRDDAVDPGTPTLEAWTAIALAAQESRHPSIGASLSAARRTPESLAAMASTLDAASGGRLELTLSDLRDPGPGRAPGEFDRRTELETYVATLRRLLDREAVGMAEPARDETMVPGEDLGIRLSIEAIDDSGIAVAARHGDDIVIPANLRPDVGAFVHGIRAVCERVGREPSTIGIALEVPVSIGRTTAEAQARVEAEPLFRRIGSPSEVGLFGTLEQCQERVIGLAHAGVTELRCILPNSPDVHDVIAQLTAMTVGSVDRFAPDAPRSRAPDPPETWGGRAARR